MKKEAFTVSEMTRAIIEATAAAGKDPFSDRSRSWNASYSWFRTKMSQSQKRAEDRSGEFWTQPRRSNKAANFRYDLEHTGAIFDQLQYELETGRGISHTLREMNVTADNLRRAEELLVDPKLEPPTSYGDLKRAEDAEKERRILESPDFQELSRRLRFRIVE